MAEGGKTDAEFVADAAKSWERVVDAASDGQMPSVGIALWASLNVERLLKIAARATGAA